MPNGLDLSFGYTPMQFEKINLIGSELSEHAIQSLVLSVPNITYLDLRGNKLNAAFGWRLVKAMKKRYLNLEYCNGVPLRALRTNAIDSLNLAGFSGHHGMYGIEVVGAIFLAHFLRLNSSLTYLNFRRNNVQKDGAKALAQSLLGNPQCMLRTVNTMGTQKCPAKEGIDFSLFLTSPPQLKKINLRKRMLDDDDFVFLEEWLRRYDCVTDLDISENYISRDGVRKLTRYIRDTKALRILNCVGLPVDLEGSQLLAKAVAESETLEKAGIPLGTCDEHPDRQQMLRDLGIGLASHPCLESLATGRAEALEWVNFSALRKQEVKDFPPMRSANWHRGQMAVYMWFMAAAKPPVEKLVFGPGGAPTKDYPSCNGAAPELWPALVGCVKELHRTLVTLSIAVPRGHANVMVLMRALTRCSSLRTLNLLGYASAIMKAGKEGKEGNEASLPQEWQGTGAAPRWLVDDRVSKIKVHWQALFGLLSHLTNLEHFNDIALGGAGNLREQPELTCVLLLQCLEGVAAEFGSPTANGENVLVARLQASADVEAFCDVLRLLNRTPLVVELTFGDKKVEVVKAQQKRLVGPLNGAPAGENVPRFTHQVVLKNNQVSEALLQQLDCHAPLKEFSFENLEGVLPSLFAALCGKERPLPVEKIRVEPKWHTQSHARKRFGDKQRRWLDGVHAALLRSERFVVIESQSRGEVTKAELDGMPPEEFAEIMTGVSAADPAEQKRHPPQVMWRCFASGRQFWNPTSDEQQQQQDDPLLVPLPMDEESTRDLSLRKLSLCMCDLRPRLVQGSRADEWPDSSRGLWDGLRRYVRPGDWNEQEVPVELPENEEAEEEDEEGRHVRFHWRDHLRIGTHAATKAIAQISKPTEMPFADALLQEGLRSLLSEGSTLTSLDLRGNGLTKADANVLLELVERNDVLVSLNMIPVTIDEAQSCSQLTLDGTGIERWAPKASNDDGYEDDEEDPEGEAYARESLEALHGRMDEGDGFVFLSLVTPQYFPELRSVTLRKMEIPLDATLAHITDALLGLPSVERLQLSDLRLSSRGAALMLQAVAEMSARLVSLNGLPLSQLVQLRDAGDGGGVLELPASIEWNDFPLGAMARLNLWPYASFPPAAPDGSGGEFLLQGRTLTDVGLRGLGVMLRYFAGQERVTGIGSATRGGPSLGSLVRIDLSDNAQITDATVADLCHTLQHPSMGASLRHSLQELSVRSCSRLRTRSAYELLNFVHHVRDVARDSAATAPLGGSLKMINGVDLEALQASSRSSGVGGRANGPPLLIRCFADVPAGEGGRPRPKKPRFAALSECDVHFFASVLHLFSHIPYCHVHIVLPPETEPESAVEALAPWGRPVVAGDDGPFAVTTVSNDSPFPPPVSRANVTAAVQAHFDAAKRFFEACPVSTQLRLSVAPSVQGCEEVLMEGDHAVLGAVPGSERPAYMTVNAFGKVKQQLQDKAAKRRRARQPPGSDGTPARPLYVNNINSQRLHCCFRTLYGKDEMELEHSDIMQEKHAVSMPYEVDVSHAFSVAASVDLQHLDLGPMHLSSLTRVSEMPMLTHINLNHNSLGDAGIEVLFRALAEVQCSVVHVAAASNAIGDEGAAFIASSLGNLPRLTSLELCDNFIQESGSIALAEAIGGLALPDEADGEEAAPVGPLAVLSVDLRGNRSRELGARRWAEVICAHPDLKFLCLAQNELCCNTKEFFLDLVCAAVASNALSVLDLQDNFLQPPGPGGRREVGPPPAEVIEEMLADLPAGEFDPAEVRRAVFIRRNRGGGGGSAPEKKGRQPQQGQQNGGGGSAQRHAHSAGPPSSGGGTSVQGSPVA